MTIARRPIASIAQVDGLQGALDGKAAAAHETALTGVHGISMPSSSSVGVGSAVFGSSAAGANAALGVWALRNLTTGTNNAAVGYDALYNNSSASGNTAVGSLAMFGNTVGAYNTAVGHVAGRYLADGSTANAAPAFAVYIGYSVRASTASATNETVIGYLAIGGGSNTVRLGNSSVTNWLPGATNVCALGNSTTAFKELYLSDGTDEWKVTVNTSGVLTTTKV